jgi:hypothetical protein
MAYSLHFVGIDDFEEHQEYAAYFSFSRTTFDHNPLLND